jgi:diguanylate cyclase (GGDEF)-like protein/PAS domain S-box-containing protein
VNYEIELNKAQKKLREIEFALNESSIVAITDNKGIIQFANDQFCKISKYQREELIGCNQSIVNFGFPNENDWEEVCRTIRNGKVWKGEVENRAKDGTTYWVDSTIVPLLDENNEPYQYIASFHDITKRKHYEEKMEQMAFFDPLTSLPNRNLLSKWVSERNLEKDQPFTVLFLDLDRFKSINDNFGHYTGDLIIKESANRLKKCLRKTDFISRQGGDEFIIILNGVHSQGDIITVINKINAQLTMPFYVNNNKIMTSTSIGVSTNTIEGQPEDILPFFETLIKQADTAMYHAKEQGGNTYCFNTETQNKKMERFYLLEQELKRGPIHGHFSIVYQPLMDLTSSKMVGVEALLRWNHPQLGEVPPTEFIPILEEFGHIIPVGKWVLESVCQQMKSWQEKGVHLQRMSVNVSPIQFQHDHFVRDLKQTLAVTQLDAHLLELEITEGTLLNIEKSKKVFEELKELGVKIAIDDFGTGYSSLSYLKGLSIDTLKIDQSFIRDLDLNNEIIVNTIIFMGKNLNFKVLAEGIESSEQLAYLRQQDCQEGQGFYWSHPVPEDLISKIYQGQAPCPTV